MGAALLACGLIVSLWTLSEVYGLLTDPENVPLLESLAVHLPRERTIVLPQGAGSVEVPPVFLKIGAYGTAAALLAIAGGIASAMLRAGASLLQEDARALLRVLGKEHAGGAGTND